MGFGFGGCGFDRCDCCVGGYGDGPCGGYYSFWDRGRCFPEFRRGRDCCGRFGFSDHGCFPFFGCSPSWRNPRCGLCINVPFGCCNLGFFLPF